MKSGPLLLVCVAARNPQERNMAFTLAELLNNSDFHGRHLGPDASAERDMLATLGVASRDELEIGRAHV